MDDLTKEIIRMLEIAVYKIWDATLVGSPCEHVHSLNQEMRNPVPGDLVVEITTLLGSVIKDNANQTTIPRGIQGIGYLVKVAKEPVWTEQEAIEQGWSGEIPQEDVTYIKLFDGTECRWTDARFIKAHLRIGGGK